MARTLTAKAVENLRPVSSKRQEIPDAALSGLYLVVQPSGVKSWALRYRFAGRPAKLTLGRWPVMGLAEARAAAAEAIQQVEHGTDPSFLKKASKAARHEAQLSERDKVKTLVDQFDRRHLSTLRTGKQVRQHLDRFVVSAWGERDIQSITRRDVIDLLDGIVDSGRATTANRVRAYLSKFFGWCVEREVLEIAPTSGVRAPAKELTRDRVLSDDELRWFWAACERVGQPWGPLGQMLLLTGQRLREVAQMTEAELRPNNVWHLSALRTKNKRAHDVPLSEAAQAVLTGVERIAGPPGYLFTNGTMPVSGFAKGRDHLARAMADVAAQERGQPVPIPHWTFHDLRRTAATGMARLGVPVRVTEAVLNHVSGTGGGIVAVYQRHDFADEKRQALEAWGRQVMCLVSGRAGDIEARK
jgi:integrase